MLLVSGSAILAAAAATVLVLTLDGGDEPRRESAPPPTTTTRLIAQYEYQFALPDGWLQTGGDPAKLRTEVKPTGGEAGDDLVLVEQIRLAFDSTADRERAVAQLRTEFEKAGDTFTGFDENASYAGRQVIHYEQALPNKDATVNWYVLFQRKAQVSVGCQHENTGTHRDEVAAACETIVRTLTIAG